MPKRGRKNPKFYHGKNMPKSDNIRYPSKGEPNTFIDFYDKRTGYFHRRRMLNEKGIASKDLDMPDIVENQKHVHDFSDEGKRSKPRNPSKKELKQMNKASRKRRFWE